MATEKRFIDVNALKNRFKLRIDWLEKDAHDEYTNGLYHGAQTDFELIDEISTVDAVEVVRCKDCEHWHEETGWCYHHSHFVGAKGEAWHPWESNDWKMLNADDFCSYGERRSNDRKKYE